MSKWATGYIKLLKEGRDVKFRPRGSSMNPIIRSGDLCLVTPITNTDVLQKGDIVLCSVRGNHFLHKISGLRNKGI